MEYNERIELKRAQLEEVLAKSQNYLNKEIQNNNQQNIDFWKKSIEDVEYQLENVEAVYTMETVWHINHVVYYNEKDPKQYISHSLGIDESLIPDKNKYGESNIEEYRQQLVELSQIKINVPTLTETIKTYHDIYNSTTLSPEEKNDMIRQHMYLTGIGPSMANYYNKYLFSNQVRIVNLSEMISHAKENNNLEVFYENGLQKGHSK